MATTTTRTLCPTHWKFDEPCCGAEETFVFVSEVTVNDRVMPAVFGTFRDQVVVACPVCGAEAACSRDVEFATGERLMSGYQPRPGEIVQNHWSICSACGWNQAS